jgi:hypothetical protein
MTLHVVALHQRSLDHAVHWATFCSTGRSGAVDSERTQELRLHTIEHWSAWSICDGTRIDGACPTDLNLEMFDRRIPCFRTLVGDQASPRAG